MSAVRTIEFLPRFFRTRTNNKFLSATLDQVISEPNLTRLDGYVGRKNAINARRTDNYIPEISDTRSQYQLEPSVVGKDDKSRPNFVSGYQDLLNKLEYLGSDVTDQSRLFTSEYYSYSGLIDFDKFVNFSQYYWLPNGPDRVNVFGTEVPITNTFEVTADLVNSGYLFNTADVVLNPVITLARGGSYVFKTTDTSRKFYIQTEPGVDGFRSRQRNLSSREVLGVYDNGTSEVTFNVPERNAQDFSLQMERVDEVDLAVTVKYSDIQGKRFSDVLSLFGGLDGQRNLVGKKIIFLNDGYDIDEYWDIGGIYDNELGFDADGYDFSEPVPANLRYGVWRINNDTNPNAIIRMVPVTTVNVNQKVLVREGNTNGNKEFYKNSRGRFQELPAVTAIQDVLYYQDSEDPNLFGEIKLVDPVVPVTINVVSDILGKKQYRSPNGVLFTNGLKIQFDTNVTPASYADRTYYVEGVGTSIKLIDETLLSTPELYMKNRSIGYDQDLFDSDTFETVLSAPVDQSYIVVNRASLDLNPWSRGNRWFHQDVITATSKYNNFIPVIDQTARANRPIIEFEADLELYNFARIGKATVTLLDTIETDAFSNVNGQPAYQIDGIDLTPGMRVIFAADAEPNVRNHIYDVNFVDPQGDGSFQIHLSVAEDGAPEIYDGIIVAQGDTRQGKCYWYNGDEWVESQQRTGLSTAPKFNVYDLSGRSFGDTSKYPSTDFMGSKIFSYKEGTGVSDPVLRFPLTYRNFQNVGDIVFENNFVVDTFRYQEGNSTSVEKVSTGYVHKILDRYTFEKKNTWEKVNEPSKQYQVFSFEYAGSNKFVTGILPTETGNIPSTKLFINNALQQKSNYRFIVEYDIPKIEILVPLSETDKIDLYIYSTEISRLGYFQVPLNLDNNSVNENFETITLGQMRNHVEQVFSNSIDATGSFPGASNLRDISIKDNPGRILQHSSPTVFASLFLTHPTTDFEKSLDYARREYTRFKNKFLEAAYNLDDIDTENPVTAVDQIMVYLNSYKTSDMPWFRSDMVPYGSYYSQITYVVEDSDRDSYELDSIFLDSVPSSRAILVYVNGVQLVKFRDYTFEEDRPALLFTDAYRPGVGDTLAIYDYRDTDGSWIPETPTKLGLYPSYTPEIILDDTFREPVYVIVGHDGSRTVIFGDFRDQILLELEKRIYNNIKVRYDNTRLDINEFLPGKFRKQLYGLDNISRLLSTYFLKWVGTNRLNYTENNYYDNNDGFTWSYRGFVDKLEGEALPGYWRGIFRYFYDTERPNMTPWEMLGFSEKPLWWEGRYGPAPYTSGNLVLWRDLEAGRILDGDRAGIDPNYARPGLSRVIPVNEYGELLSPHEFIVKEYEPRNTNLSFIVGDVGPVEAAWRNSSEYAFAVQHTMALLNPAKYFGIQIDTANYLKDRDLDQYMDRNTRQRLVRADVYVHGEDVDGNIVRTSGYLNWIGDYARSLGLSVEESVGELVRNFDVQLSYKVAGFTDKTLLKVFAEQASPSSTNSTVLIPDEDYSLILDKSVPVGLIKYSAVIIRKTNAGWSVEGYDLENPFFTIVPIDANSRRQETTVAGVTYSTYEKYVDELIIIPYGYEFFSKQQVVDFLRGYGRFLTEQGFRFDAISAELKEIQDWNLSVKEFINWSAQGWSEGNLIVLSPAFNILNIVSEDATLDAVNDPTSTNRLLDVNFKPYNIKDISVSRTPGESEIAVNSSTIGFAELNLVQYEHVAVFNNITVFNDILYQPSLGNRQSRLKLVGSKTADWNGSLNAPGFVLNQDNIPEWQPGVDYKKADLVSYKNQLYVAASNIAATEVFRYTDWIISDYNKIKTGLLPNFATRAKQIEDSYNLENINLESDIDTLSKGLIGFRNRKYMSDIGVEDASQVKFYQGFIREKGTRKSVDAFTSARLDRLTSDIQLYEDWAIRVGEYGALDSTQFIEIPLSESQFSRSPAFLSLLESGDLRPLDRVGFKPADLYRKPRDYKSNLFMTRPAGRNYNFEVNVAGPVRLDDVDYTVFDIDNIQSLTPELDNIGAGTLIWVASDDVQEWNVLRVDQTNAVVTKVVNAVDGYIFIETFKPHGLGVGDYVILKNISDTFDGFYKIAVIPSDNSMLFEFDTASIAGFEAALDLAGYLLRLVSVKFEQASDAAGLNLTTGWDIDDRFWVDNGSDQTPWQVYKKSEPWTETASLNDSTFAGNNFMGTVVSMSADGNVIAATCDDPVTGNSTGHVKVWIKDGDTYTENVQIYSALGELLPDGIRMGSVGVPSVNDMSVVVSSTGDFIIASNDKQLFERGGAAIWVRRGEEFAYDLVTGISNPEGFSTTKGYETGHALALSKDDEWFFMGAPGDGDTVAPGAPSGGKVYALYRSTMNDKTYFYTIGPSGYIAPDDIQTGDRFGHAISASTDGAQIVISAPEHNNGNGTTGAVYVYDRVIEAFLVTAPDTTEFTTVRSINEVKTRITVDQIELDPSEYTIDYITKTVTLNTAPVVGSVVRVEVNEFALIQKLTGSNTYEGTAYGTSVAICYNNCSIYVGSPNVNSSNSIDRDTGLVYRYVNQARIYGTITGEVVNPTVTIGHSIRIDDFEVTFTGTTLASVINDINNYGIPGITAASVGGRLRIDQDSKQTFSKLRILPGVGTGLEDLGLRVFVEIQQIENPIPTERGYFGYSIAINQDSDILTVGAPAADSVIDFVMDGGQTIFDDRSTTFSSRIERSGAVYVFEQLASTGSSITNTSKYILAQRLANSVSSTGDEFGTSIAVGGNKLLISSPGDDTTATDAGTLTLIEDSVGNGAWFVERSEGDYVDIESINSVFLYNKITGRKVASLDFIDPAKGKVLGVAAQELDFISEADPAYYNIGNTSNVQPDIAWGREQVGKIWWDISAVRYMDYEQGDFAYRSNNWGKMFPGSEIRVYQWVESPVPPSRYSLLTTDGFPRSPNDVEFVESQTIDKYTGGPITRYYYWVEGLTSTITNNKNLSVVEIAELIRAPQNSERPYAAFLSPSTIGLWNIGDLLVDSDIVLHVDYDVVKNDNIIHSEFQLVQENSASSSIPDKIVRKLIDSLCGQDSAGNPVPDPALLEAEQIGISFRPRQSVFRDQKAALKVLIDRVNKIMLETPIIDVFGLNDYWNTQEEIPESGYDDSVPDLDSLSYLNIDSYLDGDRVLVIFDRELNGWAIYEKQTSEWVRVRSQTFKTANYWEAIDWYKGGFNANNIKPDYVVGTEYEVSVLTPSAGQIIKVNNAGNNKFKIYQVTSSGSLEVIGLQSATVRIFDSLWQVQPPIETRNVLMAVEETYTGTIINNQILFALIRYALSEQHYIDWAFKTSFVSILHQLRQLDQFTNYQRDNQDYVEEFINEVKPYRTKIREYLLSYASLDNWDGAVTDFDLPGYYDVDFLRFRSPSGEKNKDPELWELPQNADWFRNHTLSVESIVVFNGGSGYTFRPQVTIVGGGGSGAVADAAVSNGRVTRILVRNPGSGYTSNPTVVITGGNGSGAVAVARMSNDTTRKIKTTIKFDRIDYGHNIVEWAPSTLFEAGTVVRYQGEVYTATATFVSGTAFDGTNFEVFADELFQTANNRVMAYYQPQRGMPARELSQVFAGIAYPGVQVTGRRFLDDLTEPSEVGPDGRPLLSSSRFDTLISSQFTDLALGTRPEDINISGGAFVDKFNGHAPEELLPGIIFDTLDLKVFTITNTLQEREGAGPEIYMFAFTGDGVKTSYDIGVLGKTLDNIIVYNKTGGNYREGVDFVYNRQERTITFTSAPDGRDQIYIYLLGDASQFELYDSELFGDGSTVEFSIPVVDYSLITDSFVVIDGVKTLSYSLVPDSVQKTKIVFDVAPTADQYVRVYLFGGEAGIQHYSELYSQYVTLNANPQYPVDYTITLDRELRYAGPLSSNIILEVNSQRLRPANSEYYNGDGSTVIYAIPSTVDINPDTISDNDIEVYLNGVRQIQNIHYAVIPSDGSSLRTVEFYVAPTTADEVTIALMTGSDFRINSRSELLIGEHITLEEGDEIKITSFSNHDPIKIRTQVFLGANEETLENEPGFDGDSAPFDNIRFDGTDAVVVTRPIYNLSRPVNDSNYLWVTVNGTRQLPNYDFTLRDSETLEFGRHLGITETDVIVITSFSESIYSQALGFRIFKDMLGDTYYTRISQEGTSRLAEDLEIGDTEIRVVDARVFAEPSPVDGVPGVVFIDGERITYYSIDYENNTLGRLRRSTAGTGAAAVHPAGTIVVSSGKDQEIPDGSDYVISRTLQGDQNTLEYVFPDIPVTNGDNRYVQVFVGGTLLSTTEYSVISSTPLTILLNQPVTEVDGATVEVTVLVKFGAVWYDMENPTLSLSASSKPQARFLKEKPSFIPA